MLTNTQALRDKIAERGLKLGYVAKCVKMSRQCLHNKIYGSSEFTVSEINAMRDVLNLSTDELMRIFFDNGVD